MDVSRTIARMKAEPDFAKHVGMVLAHNGIVRGWSRSDGAQISALKVTPDTDKIRAIQREIERYPGIYKTQVQARAGTFVPGDDLMLLVVAGDVRENVHRAMADLLDRIKKEALNKQEIKAE